MRVVSIVWVNSHYPLSPFSLDGTRSALRYPNAGQNLTFGKTKFDFFIYKWREALMELLIEHLTEIKITDSICYKSLQ